MSKSNRHLRTAEVPIPGSRWVRLANGRTVRIESTSVKWYYEERGYGSSSSLEAFTGGPGAAFDAFVPQEHSIEVGQTWEADEKDYKVLDIHKGLIYGRYRRISGSDSAWTAFGMSLESFQENIALRGELTSNGPT